MAIPQLPSSLDDITAKHEHQHHTRLSLWNPRTLKSGTLVAFDMSAHRQAKTNLYVANERSLMIRHATDDSPACESRSSRRKASSRFLVKRQDDGHILSASTGHHRLSQSQFQDLDPQTEELRILKPAIHHLTSPHLNSPTSNHYNNHHRGLTTPPAPSRAQRINLPLRPPQHTHTHLPHNNLPKTKHGSPTAPLPPPHQTLLPNKTLRLGQQIPTPEPKTRPQPIPPINRRRHDPSSIIRTI